MIFEKLCSILEEIFDISAEEITEETTFAENLEADLPDMIELSMILEEEFEITMEDGEIDRLETVGDLSHLIEEKLKEN